jgi:mRNA-degrading endonuclease RelE of RelBE toxin-antitoxin system
VEFLIADTFTGSLARLTADEQKQVKTTAFDLQLNPENPGHQFHRLQKAKDPNFWSVRAGRDLRLIVHRTSRSLLLCYTGHHDAAYQWAERRRLEIHPKTGAAQLVEIRERVQEVVVPNRLRDLLPSVDLKSELLKRRLFHSTADEDLLAYGVPSEWLRDVRAATEDTLLELLGHLPAEAAETLLNLATGVKPMIPQPVQKGGDPFAHPDALRRFRIMRNVEELALALDYPSEKWAVFLHPAQRQLVEKQYAGPAKVAGSAGTGKTIVALHRAVNLARKHPTARVLLTTFSEPLAHALDARLRLLLHSEPRLGERVEVHSIENVGRRLFKANIVTPRLSSETVLRTLLQEAAAAVPNHNFDQIFLYSEWSQVVDGWQLDTWEAYRDVTRLGRRTRLKESQRATLWAIFEHVRAGLRERGLITQSGMFNTLASYYKEAPSSYDHVVVDEAQDISIAQLRFVGSLGAGRADGLFFAGDLGQRIFQQPFSWKAAGVDIRGRSTTLKINYRTSHQIRSQSDRLLDAKIADVDGNTEERGGTISVFDGPKPDIQLAGTEEEEQQNVAAWLSQRARDGVRPGEIAVFVRSSAEVSRASSAAERAGLSFVVLDEHVSIRPDKLSIGTMHLAKGLEFRCVAAIACDEGILPQQTRLSNVSDESDLEDVYNTERHLLYVACTRARDHLLVSGVKPVSEFLDDIM